MDRRTTIVPPSERLSLDALALLSNKWEPAILLTLLHHDTLRFTELESALPDISPNMLTAALGSLADDELIQREMISETPQQVEYTLTDAGRELEPVFAALTTWGETHLETPTPVAVIADFDARLTELYAEWLADNFTVTTVHTANELRECLAESPDLVVFNADLWDLSASVFETHCPASTRRVLLVGDRPELSVAAWPCDEMLRKPIRKATFVATANAQMKNIGQSNQQRIRDRIDAKRALLESFYPEMKLKNHKLTAQLYLSAL